MRSRSLLTAAVLAIFVVSCGDDESVPPPSDGPVAESQLPYPGCSFDQPNLGENNGELAEQFRSCWSDDGRSLRISNVSSLVLNATSDSATSMQKLPEPIPDSIADIAVREGVPTLCFADRCQMPPDSSIVASASTGAPEVRVTADLSATTAATVVAFVGGLAQSKLTTAPVGFRRNVQACAQTAQDLVAQTQFQNVGDAVRQVLALPMSGCANIYRDVHPAQAKIPPTQADEMLRYGKQMTQNLQLDLATKWAATILRLR